MSILSRVGATLFDGLHCAAGPSRKEGKRLARYPFRLMCRCCVGDFVIVVVVVLAGSIILNQGLVQNRSGQAY